MFLTICLHSFSVIRTNLFFCPSNRHESNARRKYTNGLEETLYFLNLCWTYVLSVFHVENTEHILPVSAINSHQLSCLRKWVSATYNAYHNVKITIPLTKIKFRPIFFKNQINDSSICPKFFEPSFILFYEPSLSSSFILNYVIRCQHHDFITTIEILS